ncbi:MAG TPA: hypothetical protein VFW13_01460, partial [Phenylobacterium sp.]|nr:hypothetical protein [Phenylobacterium sp.]
MNNLYLAGIKVLRGTNQEPAELIGTVATCFAAGPDYQTAVRAGVAALRERGFQFADLVGEVKQVPTDRWGEYVATVWPEAADALPSEDDLPQICRREVCF